MARALEAERGAQGEAAGVIAYHWEGAGEPVHAARWHHRAAVWIQNRVPAEAMRHWRRVRELLVDRADTPEVAGLALAACTSLLIQGPSSGLEDVEAAAILEEGMQLARRFPDASGESRLVAAHGSYLVFRGAARDALAPLEDSVRRASESGDPVAHINALVTLGYTLQSLGCVLPALAAVDEAVALYDSAPNRIDPEEAARALILRGIVLSMAGKPGPAAESLQRGGQLLPSGNVTWLGLQAAGLANAAMARGDARSAALHAERALDHAGRTGNAVIASFAQWPRGRAQLLLGDYADALHSFEQALATGATLNLEGYFDAGIALAHLGLGDPARARRAAEHAITVARRRGTLIAECSAQLALAQILTQTEGASTAAAIETALREVERLIGETGARSYEPLFHEERARLAAALGDALGRERALGEARRVFTEMDATGHLERLDREWELP